MAKKNIQFHKYIERQRRDWWISTQESWAPGNDPPTNNVCPSGNVRLPKKVFRKKFFLDNIFFTANNVFKKTKLSSKQNL